MVQCKRGIIKAETIMKEFKYKVTFIPYFFAGKDGKIKVLLDWVDDEEEEMKKTEKKEKYKEVWDNTYEPVLFAIMRHWRANIVPLSIIVIGVIVLLILIVSGEL